MANRRQKVWLSRGGRDFSNSGGGSGIFIHSSHIFKHSRSTGNVTLNNCYIPIAPQGSNMSGGGNISFKK
jgi:hypothetical protein